MHPVTLTRKNSLFARHEIGAENWALLASLVATYKIIDDNAGDQPRRVIVTGIASDQ